MQFIQEIVLDVSKTNRKQYIFAKQGDNNSRYLRIKLVSGTTQIIPSPDDEVAFRCIKPDGKSVLNPGIINEDGTISVELTDQVLAVPGTIEADVYLHNGEDVLSTGSFNIKAEEASINSDQAVSSNEFLTLMQKTYEVENMTVGAESSEDGEASVEKTGGSGGNPIHLQFRLPKGNPGERGPAGRGVPTGGTKGQVLKKTGSGDDETEWADEEGGAGGDDPQCYAKFFNYEIVNSNLLTMNNPSSEDNNLLLGASQPSQLSSSYVSITGLKEDAPAYLKIPDTIEDYPVEVIANNALRETNIIEIILPETLKQIGTNSFYHCESLKNIILPDSLTSVGNYAFAGCIKLKSFLIGTGLSSISVGILYNCYNLDNLEIPDNITTINYDAFVNCSSLQNLTIKTGVTTIGSNCFTGCPSMMTIRYSGSKSQWSGISKTGAAIPSTATILFNQSEVVKEDVLNLLREYDSKPFEVIPIGTEDDGSLTLTEALTTRLVISKDINNVNFNFRKILVNITVSAEITEGTPTAFMVGSNSYAEIKTPAIGKVPNYPMRFVGVFELRNGLLFTDGAYSTGDTSNPQGTVIKSYNALGIALNSLTVVTLEGHLYNLPAGTNIKILAVKGE